MIGGRMISLSRKKPILITIQAAKTIRDESLACDIETGGTLLGYPRGHVISHASGPGPNSKHSSASFSADIAFQNEFATRLARLSEGKCKQLGTWQTTRNHECT